MATIVPTLPRWKKDGSQFIIPPYRGVMAILALILFVATWGSAVVGMLRSAIQEGLSGEFAWAQVVGLVSVSIVTVAVLCLLAWHLVGREVVEVSGGEIVLAFEVFGFRKSKGYAIASVSGLRSVPVPPWGFRARSRAHFGSRGGAVAFDYGARTIRFGSSLDEAEAKLLVKELLLRTPSLGRDI